jgi:3'(2'), 5'-bisphosphate nucleotidase
VSESALLPSVIAIARLAGKEILAVYGREFAATEKADHSPLTEADLAANAVIVRQLAELDPSIPILTEESAAVEFEVRRDWSRFWLVDPLDGTKEFIKRNGDFTVNIALIERGVPVLGVVFAPVFELLYCGVAQGGAFRQVGAESPEPIHVTDYQGGPLRIVASLSHSGPETEVVVARLREHSPEIDLVSRGSSLKLCMVAEGAADVYPRLGPTMEWDTAAADAIVRAAGGQVTTFDGTPLSYNKPNLLNPYFAVFGKSLIPGLLNH